MKRLIIVESPAKGQTIQKYLGKDYIVLASFGHIVDLAKGGKNGIGVDVTNNFKPHYVIMDDKIKQLDAIISAAEKCDEILIASDPDREGEAIAYHLSKRLESTGKTIKRVEFTEITKDKVINAINNPREINMDLFHAQESRRILDRIVGFMVSPFLIKNFGSNLSAGRVQSVAVRMIVDREREIENFTPEEYWNIHVNLSSDNNKKFVAKYESRITNKNDAQIVKSEISSPSESEARFIVDKVISKSENKKAPAPMITAKLQQIMAKKFGFDSERTMKAAQSLYESGYCTYMRTDSTRISDEALKSARKWLSENKHEIPKKPNVYKTKDSAQDAHECIRPTNVNNHPDDILVSADEQKVYSVIWKYFMASQMVPAVYDTLEVRIKSQNNPKHTFKATGKTLKSKGYLNLLDLEDSNSDSKIEIPMLKEKDILSLASIKNPIVMDQKFTQPPPRFTVASFIQHLETKEIGRPATYAQIVKTITSRNYVEQKGQSYYATDLGKKITDVLISFFPFMEYEYTANMEKQLDDIADGKLDHLKMIGGFFNPFKKQLASAYSNYGTPVCDKCGNGMVTRTNKKDNSKFLACSGYPKCKNTKSI